MDVEFKLNINGSWHVYEYKKVYVDTDNEADAISAVYAEYGEYDDCTESCSNIDITSVEP